MSITDLEAAKKYLGVIYAGEDDNLQLLLDGAEDEALQFLDIGDDLSVLLGSDGKLPASVTVAIFILLQASYQAGPGQMRHEAEQLREIAEKKLFPYRKNLGF